jgi:hypothetical protein
MSCAKIYKNLHKITLFTTFQNKFGNFNFSTCPYWAESQAGRAFERNEQMLVFQMGCG